LKKIIDNFFMRVYYAHEITNEVCALNIIDYDANAPKKPANLSINSDLLRQAKERNINLSKTLEQRLLELLVEEKRQQWKDENQKAIDEYNRRVAEQGVFGDGLRSF
jgi:antitoxin CcdA